MRRLALLPILALAILPSPAQGAVDCGIIGTFVEIRTTAFGDGAAVVRDGDEIVISDDRRGEPIECVGGTPRVETTERIQMTTSHEENSLYLNLNEGPLPSVGVAWPGGFLGVGGTRGPDSFSFSQPAAGPYGLLGSADVKLNELGGLLLRGTGGDDFLSALGPPDGPSSAGASYRPLRTSVTFEAGPGADAIIGGKRPDIIQAGGGGDKVWAKGGGPDEINCGGGHDKVFAKRNDKTDSCERVR
jgi:hypothetical protein